MKKRFITLSSALMFLGLCGTPQSSFIVSKPKSAKKNTKKVSVLKEEIAQRLRDCLDDVSKAMHLVAHAIEDNQSSFQQYVQFNVFLTYCNEASLFCPDTLVCCTFDPKVLVGRINASSAKMNDSKIVAGILHQLASMQQNILDCLETLLIDSKKGPYHRVKRQALQQSVHCLERCEQCLAGYCIIPAS